MFTSVMYAYFIYPVKMFV